MSEIDIIVTETVAVEIPISQTATIIEVLSSAPGPKGDDGDPGPIGPVGPVGPAGPAGIGIPVGGDQGQILAKNSTTNYDTIWIDNYANWTSQLKHEVKLSEPMTKGQAVYVSSADGTNMIVTKASNTGESTSSKTLGLIESSGNTNDKVKVVTEGLISGLNTNSSNVGDPVWLGLNGNLIYGLVNKPQAPNHLVSIGIVTRKNINNGEIFVKVQNGFELKELHDVSAQSPVNNDVLTYESTTGLWKPTKVALKYTHIQTVANTTWNITHNLGYMPSVTIIDSGGNEVECQIIYNNENSITLQFTVECSGIAYLS